MSWGAGAKKGKVRTGSVSLEVILGLSPLLPGFPVLSMLPSCHEGCGFHCPWFLAWCPTLLQTWKLKRLPKQTLPSFELCSLSRILLWEQEADWHNTSSTLSFQTGCGFSPKLSLLSCHFCSVIGAAAVASCLTPLYLYFRFLGSLNLTWGSFSYILHACVLIIPEPIRDTVLNPFSWS